MEPEAVKVVLLGESGVGKTCIISQFTEHKFDQSVLSSLSAQFVSKTIEYIDFGKVIINYTYLVFLFDKVVFLISEIFGVVGTLLGI